MAKLIERTARSDAPLSAARHPDARAVGKGIQAEEGDTLLSYTVCIDRPRSELYAVWRDFTNLPRFMENVRSVTIDDSTHSHWVISAPQNRTVEWESEMTEEVPDERIAWTSINGDVRNSGAIEFRDSPTGRGTFVTVTVAYDPPGGQLGRLLAKLLHREPKIQARQDLRRFKQLMETGEIPIAAVPAPVH